MKCPACGVDNPDGSSFCSRCGSAMTARTRAETEEISRQRLEEGKTLSPGQAFGRRYRIVEEIDRGGMGRVYKAEDKELKSVVALKIIHPHNLTNGHAVERFKKEILLAREITHENVIRIHDFGEEEGVKFISMEYVEGENLKDLIKREGSLDFERVLDIGRQICDGLQAAHRKGIVHRDLKPHNIMITSKGRVRIMDFGLAKSIEGEGISLPDMVVGTPEYLSPEQARGEKVDGRADIYSLGIILYEMATGKLPFRSETVLGYITKHLNEKPCSPSVLNPLVPNFLSRIILKCLEKNPQRRYRDVAALRGDILAEEVARGPLLRRPRVRLVLKVAAGFVFVAALAWAVYHEFAGRRQIVIPATVDRPVSVAVVYFKNNTGEEGLDRWRLALTDLFITDLAQSRYFRVLSENRLFHILRELGVRKNEDISVPLLRRLAVISNVDHVITGSFTRAGEVFRVGIRILDPDTGEFVDSGSADGRGEESLFGIVDRLTTRLKSRFNIPRDSLREDFDREVAQITTASPEALWHYVTGKHFHNRLQYRLAVESFQRAVDRDPDFAMAYWAMGWAYAYLGDFENRIRCFEKTMGLLDKVSQRERYLIRSTYFGESDSTRDQAVQELRAMLKLYPDDCEGHQALGMMYQVNENWEGAISQFEKSHETGCATQHSHMFLCYSHLARGDYPQAEEGFEDWAAAFPDNDLYRVYRSRFYLVQRQFDLALAEMKKAVAFDPRHRPALGDVYLLTDRYDQAEAIYREAVEDDPDTNDHLRNLLLLRGRIADSLAVLETQIKRSESLGNVHELSTCLLKKAYTLFGVRRYGDGLVAAETALDVLRSDPDFKDHSYNRFALHGAVYARLHLGRSVEDEAAELKASIDRSCFPKQMKIYHHARGLMHHRAGRYRDALNQFQKALEIEGYESSFALGRDFHAVFYHHLAMTHLRLGDLEEAVAAFRKIQRLTTGRYYFGDIYARSFFNLGEIYRKRGWEGKAIDQYEQFLKIWKGADPVLREPPLARRYLAELRKAAPR